MEKNGAARVTEMEIFAFPADSRSDKPNLKEFL